MSHLSLRRRATVVGCTALLAAGSAVAAQPASAGSMSFSKSSGRMASAEWLEVGTLPGGVPGNIHFGSMQVEALSNGQANVFGIVFDLQCPAGTIPSGPGGGHGEPLPDGCVDKGVRFIDGGATTFTMDRRLNRATLTGTLNVVGHDGGTSGTPAVDMTLTGVGSSFTTEERSSFSDGTYSYAYRYSFTGRAATVTGKIGPMVFDNHPDEWSSAQIGSFRSKSRDRVR